MVVSALDRLRFRLTHYADYQLLEPVTGGQLAVLRARRRDRERREPLAEVSDGPECPSAWLAAEGSIPSTVCLSASIQSEMGSSPALQHVVWAIFGKGYTQTEYIPDLFIWTQALIGQGFTI